MLRPQDKTQITMIVIWVLELFLNHLGELRDQRQENSSEYIQLQKEFDNFLKEKIVKVYILFNSISKSLTKIFIILDFYLTIFLSPTGMCRAQ